MTDTKEEIKKRFERIDKRIDDTTKEIILPAPPNLEEKYLENCEIAKAKAIISLTNTRNETLEMLSMIDSNDVPRLGLLLSISDDRELNLDDVDKNGNIIGNFLHDYCYHELRLNNSVVSKKGGIRSEQLIIISKSPEINESQGLFSKIRNRLT
jgi:hypothetical protein